MIMELEINPVALKSGDILTLGDSVNVEEWGGEVMDDCMSLQNERASEFKEKAQKILDICPEKFQEGDRDRELKFLEELVKAYYNYADEYDATSEKLLKVGWFLYTFYEGWKRGIL